MHQLERHFNGQFCQITCESLENVINLSKKKDVIEKKEPTKLTQVQAEVGSLHQAGVLAHGPDVEVHEDRQASEGRHSEPHQEEEVSQEHQLQTQTGAHHKIKTRIRN